MMRMAKIADEDGGTDAGAVEVDEDGGTDAGAPETEAGRSAETGTGGNEGNESLRARGPGGSLCGRDAGAMGRAGSALAFPPSPSAVASAGSDGMRALVDALAGAATGIEGCERRRIGGG